MSNQNKHIKSYLTILLPSLLVLAVLSVYQIDAANEQPLRPWLRGPRANRSQVSASSASSQQQASGQAQNKPVVQGTAVEVAPSSAVNIPPPASNNRSTRTADVFQNGDGFNLFVTNTCERESMKVNIKTSRPFYGVIHTRNQRQKPVCSVEGNGDVEYNLEISHVLNSQDPAYCGVIRARRDSPEEKDTLSVVVAVRVHRNIELSDDKFFLLNCTNRCRKPDCSAPSAKLSDNDSDGPARPNSNTNSRLTDDPESPGSGEREGVNTPVSDPDECTIWKFPWVITLLWCLGILLLAMIISHCIMCSSLVCRCVKTEVEEKEPSVYEGATDYEDDLYNKRHPYRIDYDNRDIYKTSNNYAPYCLEEAQTKSHRKHKRGSR